MRRGQVLFGRPFAPQPRREALRFFGCQTFPPHVAIGRFGHVGKNGVFGNRINRVRVAFRTRAGRDAEETSFGIDRVKPSVRAPFHPRDIVADGFDFPARQTGQHHRQVGFAALTGKRRRDIFLFALRIGDAQYQHMFGEPAVIARHDAGDAQGETLFS